MSIIDKFQNKLCCICDEYVVFEIIENIECDWGNHTAIQCPKCEELFSIDCECAAFQNILKLLKSNTTLFSDGEKSDYLKNSHLN